MVRRSLIERERERERGGEREREGEREGPCFAPGVSLNAAKTLRSLTHGFWLKGIAWSVDEL